MVLEIDSSPVLQKNVDTLIASHVTETRNMSKHFSTCVLDDVIGSLMLQQLGVCLLT